MSVKMSSLTTQIKYPVLHPPVPAPPEGYESTPWIRCKVKLVLAGYRFGDGVIPSLDTMLRDDSSIGHVAGKVRMLLHFRTELTGRH